MWRPEGVRFQSVDKSWKGDSTGGGGAKIEASGTSVAASDLPASPGPRH